MNIPVGVCALVLLSGCATTSVKQFQAPDGTAVKTVKCTSDPQKCFVAASESCPGSGTYRVVSSESHAGGLAADWIPGPVTWYGMSYACGTSDGKLPTFAFQGQQYIPEPILIRNPTTTNCTTYGNNINCTSR